jgi:hypothetical protein
MKECIGDNIKCQDCHFSYQMQAFDDHECIDESLLNVLVNEEEENKKEAMRGK